MGTKNVNQNKSEYRFIESSEGIIRKTMIEYAENLAMSDAERILWFDSFRQSPSQVVYVNDITKNILVGNHNHDFYEINYVLKGTVYEYINGEFAKLNEHEFLLLSPDIFHSVYPAPECTAFNILIDQNYFKNLCAELTSYTSSPILSNVIDKKSYQIINASRCPDIESTSYEIYNKNSYVKYSHKSFEKCLLETKLKEFILKILIAEQNRKISVIGHGYTTYEEKINQILYYIRDNYTTASLAYISKKFGYSQMQIRRILKKHTGCNFSDLINQYRYNHAISLLTETDTPIDRISETVGLEKTYFFRFFKRQTGYTPLQYRKKAQSSQEFKQEFWKEVLGRKFVEYKDYPGNTDNGNVNQ